MSKRPETHTFPEGVITEPLPGEVIYPLLRQQKTWSDIMHFNRNLANILAVGGTLEQIYRRTSTLSPPHTAPSSVKTRPEPSRRTELKPTQSSAGSPEALPCA